MYYFAGEFDNEFNVKKPHSQHWRANCMV